nr:NifB/NifX family molybdenum-iron cluster-binding protein [uncultured Cellulosilyticum sp.]
MKRIAVACNEKKSVEAFKDCKEFEIYETEDGQVEKEWTISNTGHNPDYPSLYLSDIGVKAVIAGDMDNNSLNIFNKKGVEAIVGVHGDIEDNVEAFLDGKLKATHQAC